MPGFDQTGPQGKGSLTGRRMGRCTNYGRNLKKAESATSSEQNDNSPENFQGRGFGFGLRRVGLGRGRRNDTGRQNRLRGNF